MSGKWGILYAGVLNKALMQAKTVIVSFVHHCEAMNSNDKNFSKLELFQVRPGSDKPLRTW